MLVIVSCSNLVDISSWPEFTFDFNLAVVFITRDWVTGSRNILLNQYTLVIRSYIAFS